MRTICLDTESYYDNDVSLNPLGGWGYAHHPKCDVYMMSVFDGVNAWAGHPKDFNFASLDGARLLSHNKAHDENIAIGQFDRGLWPKLKYAEWHCTSNLSAYLCNRRSLDQATEFLLGVAVSKAMRNYAKGKSWADIQADGRADEMLSYARDDAVYPWRIWEKYSDQWPEWERRLSELTIQQGHRGVRIHQERLRAGIVLLQRVILRATDALPWVTAGMKPSSPRGVAQACRDAGIPARPVKANFEEAAEEWEDKYAAAQPWVKALKDLRRSKRMLATLQTMQLRLRPDGTLPFSLKYFGAHTGRWAGDAGINFQNFNREPLFVTESLDIVDDLAQINALLGQFELAPDDMSMDLVDVRGMVLPPEGMQLGSVDLSQIEPRVLNKLAGNESLLQKIRDGFPIYEAHARETKGWVGGNLKKENKKMYSASKAEVLGLGYGCAWEKFITVAKTMAQLDITEDDELEALKASCDGEIHLDEKGAAYVNVRHTIVNAVGHEELVTRATPVHGLVSKGIVKDFRDKNPLITGLWDTMHTALEAASRDPKKKNDLVIDLPSGRQLKYRDVRAEWRTKVDKETGKTYRRIAYTAEADGRRKVYYGGLIVENITQAVARDIFAVNMLKIYDAGIWPMWSIHDEAVNAVHDAEEGERARSLMASQVSWAHTLPIDAELVLSDRFKK